MMKNMQWHYPTYEKPLQGLIRALCVAMLMAYVHNAGAQEPLETITTRGYVSQWFLCGPFDPDTEGGIAGSLSAGKPPLGKTDFLAPSGGVAGLTPTAGAEIATTAGPKTWVEQSASNTLVDLAPLCAGRHESVIYAALAFDAKEGMGSYWVFRTPLGARVWLNGMLMHETAAGPASATGEIRLAMALRRGVSRIVLQIPIVSSASPLPEPARVGPARPAPLTRLSATEFSLDVYPAGMLAGVVYIPRLEATGAFSNIGATFCQDALLTVFNPSASPTAPISVSTLSTASAKPLEQIIPAIAPGEERKALLAIPIGEKNTTAALDVQVTLTSENDTATFSAPLRVPKTTAKGTVYISTGRRFTTGNPEDQQSSTERRLAAFDRNRVVLGADPGYGFDLGPAEAWRTALLRHPESREELAIAIGRLRCGVNALHTPLDERVVGPETIVRNVLYGRLAADAFLGDPANCLDAWDMPAIAPQSPQILAKAGVQGIVSRLDAGGAPPLFWQAAPDATQLLHRHKRPSPGPKSSAELRQLTDLQRKELLENELNTDILVMDSAVDPPEPFYLNACEDLARQTPSIRITGAGPRLFSDETRRALDAAYTPIPVAARAFNTTQPGSVSALPDLKQAYGLIENLTLDAEQLATVAGLFGAEYPEDALDLAWRQLLYAGEPDHLLPPTSSIYADVLAGLREAAVQSRTVLNNAATYLAAQMDTLRAPIASLDPKPFASLVVFNTCAWTRTDVCDTLLKCPAGTMGIALLDENGGNVPCWLEPVAASPTEKETRFRLRFTAHDLPSMGWRTYYCRASRDAADKIKGPGAQIENDYFQILIDPTTGAIAHLTSKETQQDYAKGPLNAVTLLKNDTGKIMAGRELWAAPENLDPPTEPCVTQIVRTAASEQITLTTKFAGGTLKRTLTLYDGVPRIDCDLSVEGIPLDQHDILLTCELNAAGCAPVFGERFGAQTGLRSMERLDYRTKGPLRPSGTGVQPFYQWTAATPSDYIAAGREACVPLAPCAIITGPDAELESAARSVQAALIRRAIPAAIWPDVPQKLNTLWTDSTQFPDYNDDLAIGTGMRIVLGAPDQNVFSRHLALVLDEPVRDHLAKRMIEGAAMLVLDPRVPEGHPPLPTLILAGTTLSSTADLAQRFCNAVQDTGIFQVAPADAFVEGYAPPPETGFALLHPGAALASLEEDGLFAVFTGHASSWADTGSVPPIPAPALHWRYAIMPFTGNWRQAGVPRMANAFAKPLIAIQTGLHTGTLPAEQTVLSTDHLGLMITAVKPTGYPRAAGSLRALNPIAGITLRGYESLGGSWEGSTTFFTPLRDAAIVNLLDQTPKPLTVANASFEYTLHPCEILNLKLTPAIRGGRGAGVSLAPEQVSGPCFTRYWRANRGAPPADNLPLSVLLDGRLDDNQAKAKVSIANQTTDTDISGNLTLTAARGWSAAPAQIPYTLEPGQILERDIALLRDTALGNSGGITARTEYQGRIYADVLMLDKDPYDLQTARSGSTLTITITNRTPMAAEGYVEVIAPPSCWPELWPCNEDAVTPYRLPLALTPLQKQDYTFQLTGAAKTLPLTAKLTANNIILKKDIPPEP